jgi:hypothetical protein
MAAAIVLTEGLLGLLDAKMVPVHVSVVC